MSKGRRRYFQLAEANAQVVRLNTLFGLVMQLRGQLKDLYKKLEAGGCAPTNDRTEADRVPPELARDYAVFFGLADSLREQLEQIASTGCVIKDLDIGLVDWPALHGGREIWLCWKYGEPEIAYWHEIDGGFAGRRPVAELLASTPGPGGDPN
jgi:hypothetical protein